jgi:hypothetical protein
VIWNWATAGGLPAVTSVTMPPIMRSRGAWAGILTRGDNPKAPAAATERKPLIST